MKTEITAGQLAEIHSAYEYLHSVLDILSDACTAPPSALAANLLLRANDKAGGTLADKLSHLTLADVINCAYESDRLNAE